MKDDKVAKVAMILVFTFASIGVWFQFGSIFFLLVLQVVYLSACEFTSLDWYDTLFYKHKKGGDRNA